jgi:predicted MFS family arabinose efflux permease
LYFVFTSGRWVPAMALLTASAAPQHRGSFMSLNSAVQQLAMGLAAMVAGAVVREGPGGRLTGYPTAGLLAAAATVAGMMLIGRLRPVEEAGERPQDPSPSGEPALCPAVIDGPLGPDVPRPQR